MVIHHGTRPCLPSPYLTASRELRSYFWRHGDAVYVAMPNGITVQFDGWYQPRPFAGELRLNPVMIGRE